MVIYYGNYITHLTVFQHFNRIIVIFLLQLSVFSKRLRSEIDSSGLSQKEFAAKAGIKKQAFDACLRTQPFLYNMTNIPILSCEE